MFSEVELSGSLCGGIILCVLVKRTNYCPKDGDYSVLHCMVSVSDHTIELVHVYLLLGHNDLSMLCPKVGI